MTNTSASQFSTEQTNSENTQFTATQCSFH